MKKTKELYKYEGFKLLSLDLRETTLMGKSKLFYDFVEPDDKQDSVYTTVIIGANGTGKSNLFRIIIELFRELENLCKDKGRTYSIDGKFNLKYSLNGDIYEYSNIYIASLLKDIPNVKENGNTAYLLKNGEIEPFKKVMLPTSIVANSIMLTDKYPFFRKETNKEGEKESAFKRYKYLGVRNIPQSASTRAYVRKTVEFIVEQFEKKESNKTGFIAALKRATDFLELDNSIDIFYYTSNNAKFFNKQHKLTPVVLHNYFEEIRKKYPSPEDNPPFKLNHYLKIKEDEKLLQSICNFCNDLVEADRLIKPNYKYSSVRKVVYNLIDNKSFEHLNIEYEFLEHLRQLGMISPPEIELKRAGGYSLQESSSGEYHFFSSIVGLMATVKPTNSLVFIDEPEISLHPNWQMKYLTFIRELFSNSEYKTTHIMVATHSHFLISDLKAENSKIIGLKRENGKIEMVPIQKNIDTYGWSAEDVLYRVFGVRTTRNFFMEMELRELLHLISSKSKEKATMQEIIGRLDKVKLNQDDPLNLILEKANAYIEKL